MLDLLFGPPRKAMSGSGNGAGFNWPLRLQKTVAGVPIDEDKALTFSAVWCATRILAETAATIPLVLYRKTEDDGREHFNSPLYDMLKTSPNCDMGAMAFREGRTAHQVNWGQGFAEIERNSFGSPVALWPIHPSRVRPARPSDRYEDGRAIMPGDYIVKNPDNTHCVLAPREMLHIPGVLTDDGIWGKGVIQHHRETIGFGMAVERHGAGYFGGGAQPPGVLTTNGLKEKKERDEFRKAWKEVHGSPENHEIIIIPGESTYTPISVSMDDSQFLGTRQFNISEIARIYRVPPHMLYDLTKSSYASVEAMGIDFVMYSLLPWLKRWEEQIQLKLVPRNTWGTVYAEHNVSGLLRGDLQSRMTSYRLGIMTGIYTINEVRRLENLPTIGEAGDVHYVAANMTTVDAMADGSAPAILGQPGSDQSGSPNNDIGKALASWLDAQGSKTLKSEAKSAMDKLADGADRNMGRAPDVGIRSAAEAVLRDTIQRLTRAESNEAMRAMESKDFDRWEADFYPKHQRRLAEAMEPVKQLVAIAGGDLTQAWAAQIVSHNRGAMVDAYNSLTPGAFKDRLQGLAVETAEKFTRSILTEKIR